MGVGPKVFEGPAAWTAPEMRTRRDWETTLTAADVAELEAAIEGSRTVPLVELAGRDVPLPNLGPKLEAIRRDVVHGRGFALLHGVPVTEHDRETVARMYYGIGLWIGDPVPQNAEGHLLGHVKDIGLDPMNPEHRIYATNYRHRFHTDSCDVVALLCLQKAKSGGLSAIVSSTSLYNRMASTRPDLAAVLSEPLPVDRKGEIPEGKGTTYELAVFHDHAGLMTTIYARDFIEGAQRFDDVPRLTDLQIEAMDLLDALCESDEFRLHMDFEPGDVQLLHNHQILHARTAYEDHPEPERKRHLLRLWLSTTTDGRPLPAGFAERYGTIEPGRVRGGIRVPGQKLTAPLEAG